MSNLDDLIAAAVEKAVAKRLASIIDDKADAMVAKLLDGKSDDTPHQLTVPGVTPVARKHKTYVQRSPAGSWLALGKSRPPNPETNARRVYDICAAALSSGPAPREQLTKLAAEQLNCQPKDLATIISVQVRRGQLVVVAEPTTKHKGF